MAGWEALRCQRLNAVEYDMVDGRNPVDMVNIRYYPIIYRVLYITGGAGFLPSTVLIIESAGLAGVSSEVGFDNGLLVCTELLAYIV